MTTIEKKLFFSITLPLNMVNADNVREWVMRLLYFEPKNLEGVYDRELATKDLMEQFEVELKLKCNTDTFKIGVSDEMNNIIVSKGRYQAKLRISLSVENIEIDELLSKIDAIFHEYDGIVGYGMTSQDYFWQVNDDPYYYKKRNRSLANIDIIPHPRFKHRQIIDLECLPGHIHSVFDISFTSAWVMWFGSPFYNFIPKDTIVGFKPYHKKVEIGRDELRVMLYDSPWDYDEEENREIQWAYRRHTRLDEIAHMLEGQKVEEKNPDPSIQITVNELEHGGDFRIKYFYDSEGRLVQKSKSTKYEEYEMRKNGTVVWKKSQQLSQFDLET